MFCVVEDVAMMNAVLRELVYAVPILNEKVVVASYANKTEYS